MDLDPYIPTFEEYQRKIRRSYEDFWKYKRELEHHYPAGPNKIWDYDDESSSMRRVSLPEMGWEPYGEF